MASFLILDGYDKLQNVKKKKKRKKKSMSNNVMHVPQQIGDLVLIIQNLSSYSEPPLLIANRTKKKKKKHLESIKRHLSRPFPTKLHCTAQHTSP